MDKDPLDRAVAFGWRSLCFLLSTLSCWLFKINHELMEERKKTSIRFAM